MIIVGISLFLAFIGTILTTIVSVDHVVYPLWMKISWDTVNALLVPVVGVNIFLYLLVYKQKGWGGFILELLFISGLGFWLYGSERDGYLSIVVFFMLAVLFVMDWSSFYPIPSSQKKSTSMVPTRLDGADDLPALPVASPGVIVCCSICKVQNPYDICLDCEINHKTEIHKVRSHNMRAKKAGEPATLTIAEWLQTLAEYQYRCAYCPTGKYEVLEHYFPLGSHDRQGGTTALNCVPSCRKCNLEKSNKHPEK